MSEIPAEAPYLHEASGTVRFWVLVGGKQCAASVSREALHYRYRPDASGDDPMATFANHLADIEDAVRMRFSEGALEPVMLREYDLRSHGTQGPT